MNKRYNIRISLFTISVIGITTFISCDSYTSLEGNVEPLFGLSGPKSIYHLEVLPDETGLIFSSSDYDDQDGEGGIGLYSLNTGDSRWLLEQDEMPGAYYISPDGTNLLCTDYENSEPSILNIEGGERLEIDPLPAGYVVDWFEEKTIVMFHSGEDYYGYLGTDRVLSLTEETAELFTYNIETDYKETVLKITPNPPFGYSSGIRCIVNETVTEAVVTITYIFDWETETEIRYYDLETGLYDEVNLPFDAEMISSFTEDGSKALSGDDIHSFADDIGYVDIQNWSYVKVTDSDGYDHSACWSPKGDTIYFVRDQRVFKVSL